MTGFMFFVSATQAHKQWWKLCSKSWRGKSSNFSNWSALIGLFSWFGFHFGTRLGSPFNDVTLQ